MNDASPGLILEFTALFTQSTIATAMPSFLKNTVIPSLYANIVRIHE